MPADDEALDLDAFQAPESAPAPAPAPEPLGAFDLKRLREVRDLTVRAVDVPEWGMRCYVRTLTALERDEFERETFGLQKRFAGDAPEVAGLHNIRARLVAKVLCDEQGRRVFADMRDGVAFLQERSGVALDRLWTAASRLNGLGEADVQALAGN